jgi:leucine dehydrogenase
MEGVLKKWDGEFIIIQFDHPSEAWIIIAIHSTILGPAIGGTRMKHYSDLKTAINDALRLSRSMTYKYAVANFPAGGGKGVICIPSNFDENKRSDLLRHYGAFIRQLGGLFQTGPDVGTSSLDMDIMAETGAPYIFSRTVEKGGAGGSGEATALGVFSGMQIVCKQLFNDESLQGRRVLVQGVGSVGAPLIDLLLKDGADILFSDVNPLIIQRYRDEHRLSFIPPEDVYDTPCDIYAPCALGGVLNQETVPRLKCKAIVGAANNQLADLKDAERLHDRNILYVPDYVINIGGAMAITGIEAFNWSRKEAYEKVESIKHTLQILFDQAASEGTTLETIACRLAESRLIKKKNENKKF